MKTQQSEQKTPISTVKQLLWFLARLEVYTKLHYTSYQELQAAQQNPRIRVIRLSPVHFFTDPEVNINIQQHNK